MNPHSAPLRRTSAKVNFEDPIKDYCIWPAGVKPDTKKSIKLNVSVRALVEDNMAEIEDNYVKHVLGASSYIDMGAQKMSSQLCANAINVRTLQHTRTINPFSPM